MGGAGQGLRVTGVQQGREGKGSTFPARSAPWADHLVLLRGVPQQARFAGLTRVCCACAHEGQKAARVRAECCMSIGQAGKGCRLSGTLCRGTLAALAWRPRGADVVKKPDKRTCYNVDRQGAQAARLGRALFLPASLALMYSCKGCH